MPISKPFVIATEGRTVDGRNLPRDWLEQAAASYDPATYTAVVNLNHYLAFDPESTFSAQGKVLSLATKTAKILGEERLQLTATVEASEAAAKLQASGKKCFASVEIFPNFADTGKAYLTGLALTDTPAALGTEPMRFSAFSGGDNAEMMSMAQETRLKFRKAKKLSNKKARAKIYEAMTNEQKNIQTQQAEFAAVQQKQAEKQSEHAAVAMLLKADIAVLSAALTTLQAEFAELKTALAATDASGAARPLATGGNSATKTDC